MAQASRLEGDVYVAGTLRCETLAVPTGTLTNAGVATAAAIAATKLEHQHAVHYYQADGSDVVAAIVPVALIRGATAEIVAVQVVCVDAPSGGDKAFTVDIKKADEATPTPATVLSAVVTVDATIADCEVVAGTVSSADLVVGDTVLVVVAVSGSTGTQGQGLLVVVTIREDAE